MKQFATAFVKMQGEFSNIAKTATVKVKTKSGFEYSFDYAPYDEIVSHIRPIMLKHGFGFMQIVKDGFLVTVIMHESGEMMESSLELKQQNDVKEFGGYITYMRRYGLSAALGLVTDDDDDGNVASGDDAIKTTKADNEDNKPWFNQADLDKYRSALIKAFESGDKTPEDVIKGFRETYKVSKKFAAEIEALANTNSKPELINSERAKAMALELEKLGYARASHTALVENVIARKVRSLEQLSEAEALEVWSYAKRAANGEA